MIKPPLNDEFHLPELLDQIRAASPAAMSSRTRPAMVRRVPERRQAVASRKARLYLTLPTPEAGIGAADVVAGFFCAPDGGVAEAVALAGMGAGVAAVAGALPCAC
ncbi:hypothetical protein JMG10_46910, partial [Nostoc ellipsosporum NOK]|nr:hypothetical protein [Nostoc ellipsosporum NOK]